MSKINCLVIIVFTLLMSACKGGDSSSGGFSSSNTPGVSGGGSSESISLSNFSVSVGNTFSLTASGGSGSYAYSLLSGGAYSSLSGRYLTGISVGSGSISVSDGSNSTTATFSVKGVDSLMLTSNSTCAKTTDDRIQCFGQKVEQSGSPSENSSVLALFSGATSIAKDTSDSYDFACATISGAVKCVGSNNFGQLGNGSTTDSSTPVTALDSSYFISKVVAGKDHVCALSSSGDVYCWGRNQFGQVGVSRGGDGSSSIKTSPQLVNLPAAADDIVSVFLHTCAKLLDGSLHCWGYNSNNQLGVNTSGSFADYPVETLSAGLVNDVSVGESHSCALIGDDVYCWGNNGNLQLGFSGGDVLIAANATNDVQNIGVGKSIDKIIGGMNHTCALHNDKTVKCWGANGSGQLGQGSQSLSEFAPIGTDIYQVEDISSGANHVCVTESDKKIRCWGSNSNYQLGKTGNSSGSPAIPSSNWQ